MNFRIDGRSLAAALLFAVSVVTGCSDSDDRVNVLVNQGIKYFDHEKLAQSRLAFTNALKIDNNSAEPYFYLGKIAAAQGDVTGALVYYKKAIVLNADYTDARLHLSRLYANTQSLQEAQEQVDALLSRDAENNDARALQALIELRKGKKQDAVALLKKILVTAPKNLLATELLARYYIADGEESKALQVLERGNEANAGTEDGILKPLLALYTNRKLSGEAEKVLLQLVNNNQDNLQYYRTLIQFYARLDRVNEAVPIIRDSITKDPENDARYQLLIDLYKSRYGFHKAISETRELINKKPEMSSLRLALARLYAADKQVANAEAVYQGVIDMDGVKPNSLVAKVEIAKLHLQRNERVKAEALIDEVLTQDSTQEDALLLRSGIAMQQKDFKQASLMINTVIQNNPDNAQAHMQMAVLLARQGKLDESLIHIDAVLVENDRLVSVLKLKAKILNQQRNYVQLESVFTKLETVSPNSTDGFLGNAKLLLSQKKNRQALLKFKEAYSIDSKSVESLRGIIAAEINLGETKEAEQLLERIIKNNPQHPVAIELLGGIYSSKNEFSQAEKTFLRQLEVGTTSKSIYIQLAQTRMKQDNQAGAIDALNLGVDKQPRNLNLRIKLAQAYELVGDLEKAEGTLEKTITLAPNNAQLKTMLASVRKKQQQ